MLINEKIKSITKLGEGLRVSIDFIDNLEETEGVLVGNTNKGFVLLLSESADTDYAPARPFRVNCGSVHQYIHMGDGKVKYLSDLLAGEKIPVVSTKGERYVSIGRLKKEKREMKRIELENGVSATLQDVVSVRLFSDDETPIQFTNCTTGDLIVSAMGSGCGTHKGEVVDEYIEEI